MKTIKFVCIVVVLVLSVFVLFACEGGQVGRSAFDIWLEAGNVGTEADFLQWLRGSAGQDGEDGKDGLSAFEIWLAAGNIGDEEYFLEWLRRPPVVISNFTLSFNGTNFDCITLPKGAPIWQPSSPTRINFKFDGWYTDGDFEMQVIFPFVLDDDTVLYAKWSAGMVSAGNFHTLKIDAEGSLWAWGSNNAGQIGDGTQVARYLPVRIMRCTLFFHVSAGNLHSLAIDTCGNLWAWGYNGNGRLGDGTLIMRRTPVKIKQGTLFSHVSAGENHSVAIDRQGNLWAWGSNNFGGLGDGTTTNRHYPIRIMNGIRIFYISAGSWHSLAIDNDGNLWVWGDNRNGQLGDGTMEDRHLPVRIEFEK